MSRKQYAAWVQVVLVLLVAMVLVGNGFVVGYASHSLLLSADRGEAQRRSGEVLPEGPGPEAGETFDVFWEAWDFIRGDFYGELPNAKQMTYGAIRGVIKVLDDPDTGLIDPAIAATTREDMMGVFEGIGATVRLDEEGYLAIVQPFEGQPAAQAGILAGDVILEVDGTRIQGMDIYEAISLIRGPAGTRVRLLVQRLGEEEAFLVSVVRGKIEIPTVQAKILARNVAYVRLNDFHARATAQLSRGLQSLLERNPVGVILDLRDNPGGLLDTAVDVSNLFLEPEQVILVELRKGEEKKTHRAKSRPLAPDIPLVVLINGGSASASEIVAGSVQDNRRGVLLGEPTLGKGSVQVSRQLSDGAELRITTAQWLTPSGHALRSGNGLLPDLPVPMSSEDFRAGRDPQLGRAIEYLTSEDENSQGATLSGSAEEIV